MGYIEYPRRPSEAEIGAELWVLLRENGVDAQLQVQSKFDHHRARFDIVAFIDHQAVAIVECKSWWNSDQIPHGEKQLFKYMQWELPVFVCGHRKQIPNVLNAILAAIKVRNKKTGTVPPPLE